MHDVIYVETKRGEKMENGRRGRAVFERTYYRLKKGSLLSYSVKNKVTLGGEDIFMLTCLVQN